jgi:lysyl endopeptidase
MDSFFTPRHRQTGRLLLTIGLGAFLGFGSAGWAKPPVLDPVLDNDGAPAEAMGVAGPSQKSLKPVRPTPSEALGIDLANVPSVRLKALDVDALLREDAITERSGRVKGLRYGVGRDVQVSALDGNWYDAAGGARLWVGEIVSTDALGVRVHFKDVRLPAGAQLAVYAPLRNDPSSGVVKSGFSRFDPDRYVEFYEASAAVAKRGSFWTGSMMGDRVRIEYLAPAGAAASAELPFAVDDLQHLYLDPVDRIAKSLAGAKAAAGPCHNDVTCYPEWADTARAVSGIGSVSRRDSLFCTGQLLNINAKAPDFTPYWLTANHCISTQGEAESAEFYWLYQTSSCNAARPAIQSSPRSVGASLVSTNDQSDYTLLMVEGALPNDLFWSGWTSAKINDGTPAASIHHPSGDFKRISFAEKGESSVCGPNFVRINWTDGPTEPGSSGSGVFRQDTQQLFGQLLGGPSACGNESFDCYGAFSTTYTRVKNFLKGGSDDNSEQNDSCKKAKNVRAGRTNSRIVKVTDSDWYKISVPAHRTVTITVEFANANGDVDLAAFGNCNSDAIATSTSSTDSETISIENVGSRAAFAYWQVFLDSDTRNNYDLTVTIQ